MVDQEEELSAHNETLQMLSSAHEAVHTNNLRGA